MCLDVENYLFSWVDGQMGGWLDFTQSSSAGAGAELGKNSIFYLVLTSLIGVVIGQNLWSHIDICIRKILQTCILYR